MSYSDTNPNLPRGQEYAITANDGYSNVVAPTTAPTTTPTTTPTTIPEPFPTLFKNLFKAIWCLLVAFFAVLGFNNVSYQVGTTPSNSQTPRIIFVSIAILGPLLLYAFWDIIYTGPIALWTVSRVGTCISSPLVCLSSAFMALSQSQRTLNNNDDERLLVPLLKLETTYTIWSDELNSDMQRIFKVTDTETSSAKGSGFEIPPLSDLIITLGRLTVAIEIISDRNNDEMRDKAADFLVPRLQALQTRTTDLRKFYESYRTRLGDTLSRLAIECHKVANRVSRLEHEWELILDEAARIGNEWKGDGVPQPGSVLRRDCDDEHKPSRFAFFKAKQMSKYCTFEELASMIYHQILAEHHDHAVLQKSISTSIQKRSEEFLKILGKIKARVKDMQLVAKAANEEKTGVWNDKTETWASERNKIRDYLGWGSWGAPCSKEEKEARRKESAIIDSLGLDVKNLDQLGFFSNDMIRMMGSDIEMWAVIIDHSQKFLYKQSINIDDRGGTGKIFAHRTKAEKREPDEVRMDWFGDAGWETKKGDEKSNTESRSAAWHERIAELRQWGKDVSKWAKMKHNFGRLLIEFFHGKD